MLICLLLGAVLGQRFKVQILIPAMPVALVTAVAYAHVGTQMHILVAAFSATVGLQIGYGAGIGIRYSMVLVRAGNMRPKLSSSAAPRNATN